MGENDKKLTLLDIIKNIESSNKMLSDDEINKSFSPFIVNRVLARNQETLVYAYTANKMHFLNKKMLYKYLYNAIPKKTRYGKWGTMKAEKPDEIELFIMKKYQINFDIARMYLELYDEKQIKEIKTEIRKEKLNGKR